MMVAFWAAIILVFDQISKFFVESQWALMESRPVIENIFHITRVHNTGAAFGVLKDQLWLLILATLILFFLIFRYYHFFPQRTWWQKAALGFIIGGALGNLVDRIFRGFVVDFLDFQIWPVFNVADAAITVALFLYLYQLYLEWREERNA